MSIILIIFCIWGASALVRATSVKRQQRELERIKAEQQRQRAERQEQIRQHNEEIRQRAEQQRELMRLAKAEREQAEWNRKQEATAERERRERIAADAKLAKEQEKYEIRLSKVEAEQRKMRFEIDQINEDLPLLHRQLDGFMEQMNEWQSKLHKAQLDLEWDELRMREASSAVKGKEHDAHLKAKATAEGKIISLEKNIRKAEKQIATAEFKKSEYTRKLEVA